MWKEWPPKSNYIEYNNYENVKMTQSSAENTIIYYHTVVFIGCSQNLLNK